MIDSRVQTFTVYLLKANYCLLCTQKDYICRFLSIFCILFCYLNITIFAFHFLFFLRLLNLKSIGCRRWSLLILSYCFFKGQLHQHWKPWTWPARAAFESAHIYSISRKRSRFVYFVINLENITMLQIFFHLRFKWNKWIDFLQI